MFVRRIAICVCFFLAAVLTSTFAQAQSIWVGPANGDISVAGNWSPSGLPSANGGTAEWNGSTAGSLVLTCTSTGLNGSAGNAGLNLYVNAAQTGSLSIATTNTTPRLGNILIDPLAGAFTLGPANPVSGGSATFANGVTTRIWTNNSSNAATIGANQFFSSGGAANILLELGGSGNWVVNANMDLFNDRNGLTLLAFGPGTTTLTATNAFSNASVAGGTLVLANTGALLNTIVDCSGTGTISFGSLQSATFNALQATATGSALVLTNTSGQAVALTLNGQNSTVGFAVPITGLGSLNAITTSHTLVLSSSNTYSGSTTISGGGGFGLRLGGSASLGLGNSYASNISIASGDTFTFNSLATQTISGQISGSGAVTMSGSNGAGVLFLTGNNTYTGLTTLSGGTLNLGSAAALGGLSATGGITFSGGVLQYSAANAQDLSANFVGSGSPIAIDTNNRNITFANPIVASNTGGLMKLGVGTLTLAASNSYGGTTLVGNGTLLLTNPAALSGSNFDPSGAGTLSFGALTAASFGGLQTASSTAVLTLTNTASAAVSLTVGGNNATATFSGQLTDNGAGATLTKVGNGMLTLAGPSSSLAGGTTISGGVLAFAATTAIPYASPYAGQLTLGAGALAATPILGSGAASPVSDWLNTGLIAANPSGAIALTNSANDTEAIALSNTTSTLSLGAVVGGSATYGGTLTPFGSTYYLGGGGGKLTYTPQITAAKSLVVGNGGLLGTVLLTNTTNNYSGLTTLAGGTLALSSSAALPAGASITFTGGAFQPNNTFDYSSQFVNSTGPIIIDTNGLNITYATPFAASNTGGLTKVGAGSLTLTASNTYTAPTTISAGTLAIAGGVLGNGNYSGNIVDNGVLFYNSTATQTLGGNISGGGSLVQTSTGVFSQSSGVAMTVSGSNTYTGPTTVHAGRLVYSGSLTGNTNTFTVADTVGQNAVAILSGNITANNLLIGNAATAGAVYQTGGVVNFTQAANVADFAIGASGTSAGYYKMSGGSLNINEIDAGGSAANTVGVMDVTGGTVSDNGYLNVGRGSGTGSGVVNVTGGIVTYGIGLGSPAGASPLELNWAATAGAISVINVGGGTGAATVTGTSSTTLLSGQFAGYGLNLASVNVANTFGIANLLSNGTLTTSEVAATGGATATSLLNFNGGTLKATATNTGVNFLNSSNITGIYIFSGGGTIDDNGTAITVNNSLLAPTGSGVTTIAVSSSGSGYIGAPMVTITGGTGRPATAVANMVDDGTGHGTYKIASITITSPGVYSVAPTAIVLTGGTGSATTLAAIGAISTATDVGGGLTKAGAGTLTLSGSNNYTGATLVSSGTLLLANQNALSQSSFNTGSPGTLSFGALTAATFGGLSNTGNLPLLNATPAPINLSVGNNSVNSTYSGTLTGSGGTLTKVGSGLLDLAASNGYGGGTVVSAGTLQLGNDNALGAATAPLTASGGVLDLNGHKPQQGVFSGSGTIDNLAASTTGTLTVGVGNVSSNFAGTLQGSAGVVALAKTGTGTLTLSGTSTSANVATSVNGGTLLVNGKLGGSGLTVQNAATLGGSGTITSPVTLANGSTLTADIPGAGNGLPLNVGPLTFGSISSDISMIDVALGAGVTPTAGTINVGGGLTVNSGANGVTINLDALSNTSTGTFELLKYTGGSLSSAAFSAFNLVGRPNRLAATLVNDGANDSIDLHITGRDFPVWTGTSSTAWDTSTFNWVLGSNHSVQTQYVNSPSPDNAVFDDTAAAGHTAVTISGSNVSPASVTFNNSVNNYTISGPNGIAGLGSLTKNGAGTTTISTSNSYTGGTFVNAGILQLGNSAALGAASGQVTVNGGTLDLHGLSPTVGGLGSSTAAGTVASSNGAATLTVQTVAPSTYSGAIVDGVGPVGLTVSGSSVVTLAGNNTYSGLTLLQGGELGVASAGAIPSGGTITFTGGALQHSAGNTADYSAQIFNSTSPIAIDTNGQAVTYNNPFDPSNTGGLTKLGAGSLSLTASNTYGAATTVSGGTLAIGGGGVLGANAIYGGNIAVASSAALNYNSTSAQTFSGVISGGGALAQTGAGFLTLTATNTYSGGTQINGGTLQLGNNATVGSESTLTPLGSGTVSVTGGGMLDAQPGSTGTTYPIGNTILLNGGTFWQADGNQQLGGPITIGPSGGTLLASWGNKSLNVNGVISGSGELTIGNNGIGPGGLAIVTNVNTFSGTLDVSGNLGGPVTLQLTIPTAFANATVNADGGTFTYTQANITFGALEGTGSFALPTGALTVGGIGANTTYNGMMAGTGGLTIQGPGAFNFGNGETLTGPLTVSSGTFGLSGGPTAFGSLSGTNSGTLVLGGGDFTVTQTTAGTYAGMIAGNGNLNLGSSSTAPLTLTGSSTFSGNTTVSAGTLALDYTANSNAKLGGGLLSINNATVTINGGSSTEPMSATSFGDGFDQIVRLSGSSQLGLGSISATPGAVVSFSGTGIATTTSPNDAGGILGAQYTIAGLGFATNSGGTVALATTVFFAPSNTSVQNVLLIGSGSRTDGRQANTLAISTSGAGQSLNLAGGVGTYTLTDGGLLFSGTDNYTVTGGSLSSSANPLFAIVNGTGVFSINSAIVDNSGLELVKLGPGTLVLGGVNSYSGETAVNAGTLRLTSAGALGNSTNVAVSSGATVDVQANLSSASVSWTVGGSGVSGSGALINSSTSATGTVGGQVNLTADTTVGGAGNLNISGNVSGNANLIEAGPGTTTLSGNNSWNNTFISGGTLSIAANNALPTDTVTFTGPTGGLNFAVGVNSSPNSILLSSTATMYSTVSGGGTLTLGQGSLQVGSATTASGLQTLDMSGLGTFVYNNSSGSILAGGNQSGGTGNLGVLNLAQTNSITAALFSAGWFNANNGTGTTTSNSGTINLGQMNTIDANRVGIADGTKNQGTVEFLPGLSNPTLVLRDAGGGDSATMLIGFNNSGQVPTSATIDLVTGVTGRSTLDAIISSGTIAEDVGNGGGGTGQPAVGVFNMGGGSLDAQSLFVGVALKAADSGTFGIYGGRANVGTLTMGFQSIGAIASPTATVTLDSGGTLDATTVQSGTGSATQIFNWNNGTIANLNSPIQGITGLTVSVPTLTMAASGTHTVWVDSGQSGTISSDIGQVGGAASLFMDGGGTLTLSGTNTYSGVTKVSDGELIVTSSLGLEAGSSLSVGSDLGAFGTAQRAAQFAPSAAAAVAPVPEPGTLGLLAAAAVVLVVRLRRKTGTWSSGLKSWQLAKKR